MITFTVLSCPHRRIAYAENINYPDLLVIVDNDYLSDTRIIPQSKFDVNIDDIDPVPINDSIPAIYRDRKEMNESPERRTRRSRLLSNIC